MLDGSTHVRELIQKQAHPGTAILSISNVPFQPSNAPYDTVLAPFDEVAQTMQQGRVCMTNEGDNPYHVAHETVKQCVKRLKQKHLRIQHCLWRHKLLIRPHLVEWTRNHWPVDNAYNGDYDIVEETAAFIKHVNKPACNPQEDVSRRQNYAGWNSICGLLKQESQQLPLKCSEILIKGTSKSV